MIVLGSSSIAAYSFCAAIFCSEVNPEVIQRYLCEQELNSFVSYSILMLTGAYPHFVLLCGSVTKDSISLCSWLIRVLVPFCTILAVLTLGGTHLISVINII